MLQIKVLRLVSEKETPASSPGLGMSEETLYTLQHANVNTLLTLLQKVLKKETS